MSEAERSHSDDYSEWKMPTQGVPERASASADTEQERQGRSGDAWVLGGKIYVGGIDAGTRYQLDRANQYRRDQGELPVEEQYVGHATQRELKDEQGNPTGQEIHIQLADDSGTVVDNYDNSGSLVSRVKHLKDGSTEEMDPLNAEAFFNAKTETPVSEPELQPSVSASEMTVESEVPEEINWDTEGNYRQKFDYLQEKYGKHPGFQNGFARGRFEAGDYNSPPAMNTLKATLEEWSSREGAAGI